MVCVLMSLFGVCCRVFACFVSAGVCVSFYRWSVFGGPFGVVLLMCRVAFNSFLSGRLSSDSCCLRRVWVLCGVVSRDPFGWRVLCCPVVSRGPVSIWCLVICSVFVDFDGVVGRRDSCAVLVWSLSCGHAAQRPSLLLISVVCRHGQQTTAARLLGWRWCCECCVVWAVFWPISRGAILRCRR